MAVKKVDGRWQAKGSAKRPDGKRISWHRYFKTKREAQDFENSRRSEIEKDTGTDLTVDEWVQQVHKTESLTRKESTLIGRMTTYKNHFKNSYGSLKLKDITPQIVQIWMCDLVDKGLNLSTINMYRIRIGHYFTLAEKQNLIQKSPFKSVEPLKSMEPPKEADNYWSQEEFDQLIAHCSSDHRFAYDVLWTTGMRIGEAQALTWKDYQNGKLRINKTVCHYTNKITSPKTHNSNRTVSIPDYVQQEIQERHDRMSKVIGFSDDWYILGDYKFLEYSTFHYRLWTDCDRAGVKRITPHGFRHSHASILIMQGVPDVLIADRLGHSIEMLHKVYAHIYQAQKDALSDKLEAIFGKSLAK